MNRKHTIAALVAAGTAAGLAFVGTAALVASPGSKPIVQRIHLVERESKVEFVDLGKKGPSLGDRTTVRSDVLTPAGKLAGRADFDCVVTGLGARMGGLCHGVVTLRGGQLTGAFAFGKSGATAVQAITGGTGKYVGARGQFRVTVTDNAREPFTIDLVD